MSSDCPPTIIVHSLAESSTDVSLSKILNNDNVNEQCLELLPNDSSASFASLLKTSTPGNVSNDGSRGDQRSSKLKTGDLVYIITFVDVHHIYVRNVEDDNNVFKKFTKNIHLYCLAAKPIRYRPKLNEIVGAKYSTDGLYYRARILKQISFFRYSVHFIDYGNKETVYSSNIVSLPTKYTQIPSKISLVKLKDIQLCKLNKDACAYVDVISDHETIAIDYIQEDTNHVILKTSKNQNINSHLNSLIFGKKNNIKTNDKSEEKTEIGLESALKIKKTPATLDHDVVHGPRELDSVLMTETSPAPVQEVVHGPGETSSVGTMMESLAPPAMSSVGTITESLALPSTSSVGTMTESPETPVTLCVGTMTKFPALPCTFSVGTTTESPVPPATSSVGTMMESLTSPATSSVGTMMESLAPPATSSVGTMVESPDPLATSSVGTMTESVVPPATSRWKRFKKSFRRFVRHCSFR